MIEKLTGLQKQVLEFVHLRPGRVAQEVAYELYEIEGIADVPSWGLIDAIGKALSRLRNLGLVYWIDGHGAESTGWFISTEGKKLL